MHGAWLAVGASSSPAVLEHVARLALINLADEKVDLLRTTGACWLCLTRALSRVEAVEESMKWSSREVVA